MARYHLDTVAGLAEVLEHAMMGGTEALAHGDGRLGVQHVWEILNDRLNDARAALAAYHEKAKAEAPKR